MAVLRTLLISIIDFLKMLVGAFASAIKELFYTMKDLKK